MSNAWKHSPTEDLKRLHITHPQAHIETSADERQIVIVPTVRLPDYYDHDICTVLFELQGDGKPTGRNFFIDIHSLSYKKPHHTGCMIDHSDGAYEEILFHPRRSRSTLSPRTHILYPWRKGELPEHIGGFPQWYELTLFFWRVHLDWKDPLPIYHCFKGIERRFQIH